MPLVQQCINVAVRIGHAVLVDRYSPPSKAHGGKPIILRDNNIACLYHVDKGEVYAVVSFRYSDSLCSGLFKNMRGIAEDNAVDFELIGNPHSYINNGAAVSIN